VFQLLSPIAKDERVHHRPAAARCVQSVVSEKEEPTFHPETFLHTPIRSPPAVSAIPEGAQSSSEKVLANFAYGSDAEESEEGAPSARR
jgi:hypothetical protein